MKLTKSTGYILVFLFFFYIIYFFALTSVCERFFLIKGYDRCEVPDFELLALFLILAISVSFFLPRNNKPSTVLVWTIYLMHVFGAIALVPYFVSTIKEVHFIMVLLIMLGYITFSILVQKISLSIKFVNLSSSVIFLIIYSLLLINLLLLIYTFGIRYNFASIFSVYDVRAVFKAEMRTVDNPFVSYAILLTAFMLSPLNILYGLHSFGESKLKSLLMTLTGLFATSQIFAIAAFKSSIAVVLLTVPMSLYIGKKNDPFFRFIMVIASIILILFLIQFTGLNRSGIDHWFRRVFITPSMNVIYYFEAFGFFNFGSGAHAPSFISEEYYGSPGSANSGLIGNGFAKGGVFGVILNLLILSIFCILLDAVTKFAPASVSLPLAFVIGYSFSNSAATTVLASYGGFLMIFVLYSMSGGLKRNYKFLTDVDTRTKTRCV